MLPLERKHALGLLIGIRYLDARRIQNSRGRAGPRTARRTAFLSVRSSAEADTVTFVEPDAGACFSFWAADALALRPTDKKIRQHANAKFFMMILLLFLRAIAPAL